MTKARLEKSLTNSSWAYNRVAEAWDEGRFHSGHGKRRSWGLKAVMVVVLDGHVAMF